MRATRAYLAGFGTSGSLLAGAALMFLLGSAFVAFQGWPQVAGQSSPVLVSVPRVSAPAATRASRALSATTAAPARGASGAGAALGAASHVNRTHAGRGSDQTTLPVSRDPGTGTGHHTGPTPTPRTCTSGCQSGHGPIPSSRPTVSKTIAGTTHSAGTTVNKVVGTVKKVIPISKGSGSGGGVTGGVVTTATSVVTTATNVVKGATGGLP